MTVAEEGIIAAIAEPAAEEEVVAEEAQAPELEVEAKPKKVVESISKEQFFAEIEKLNAKIDALTPKEEVKEELKEEPKEVEVELSTEEPKEEIVHSPEAVVEKKVNLYAPKHKASRKEKIIQKLNNIK